MQANLDTLAADIEKRLSAKVSRIASICGELTYEVAPSDLLAVCTELRDGVEFKFEQLIDVAGIDYLDYGRDEWRTQSSTTTGFSRGVNAIKEQVTVPEPRRFGVVYHLLSTTLNQRVRLRCYCADGEPPMIDSVVGVWASANWFEREAFDLFGILFLGHPDLRRILTDYGFIGHPFRKDFPLIGNVEVRYDATQGRVIYQPVTIEPRTLVPRVIREDNRYEAALTSAPASLTQVPNAKAADAKAADAK